MDDYLALLHRVDAWYRRVQRAHPDKVTCTRGCRECCLGLFDITLADRALLRAGLATLDPATRRDIEERSDALLAQLRQWFPDLGDTLAGMTDDGIDEVSEWLGPVECPALGRENECRLYAHRPLTCRLHGVPVVDRRGEAMHEEGCRKCRLTAAEAPRMDCDRLCRAEGAILERRFGRRGDTPLLIPQALASRGR